MSDSKAMSEREAFEAWAAEQIDYDTEKDAFGNYIYVDTDEAWIGWQARASLAASAGSVVDISDRPGCVMHMPTADEIDKLRDEARRVSRAGVEWMRIEERAEVLANLADLALAGLAASAGKAECAYALIGRQLISSGLYDRMTDADSNVEAAGLISELISVVDPILSTKYERHNAAPTPAAARDERGAFDLLLNEFAATQRELAIKGESCSMRVIEHSNKLRAQIMARAAASPGVSAAARDVVHAARAAVREELDAVSVHPCDEHDDEVRSRGLSEHMRRLYSALAEIERLDRVEGES